MALTPLLRTPYIVSLYGGEWPDLEPCSASVPFVGLRVTSYHLLALLCFLHRTSKNNASKTLSSASFRLLSCSSAMHSIKNPNQAVIDRHQLMV